MRFKLHVRKILGLFLLYCLIIFGIFAIQFSNNSLYIKDFGQLKVTLQSTESTEKDLVLKDNFQVVYKGLLFFSTETKSVLLSTENSVQKKISLLSYEEQSNGFSLIFEEGVRLSFTVSSTEANSSLSVQATLPRGTTRLILPYKITGGFIVTGENSSGVLFASSSETYTLSGVELSENEILLSSNNRTFAFIPYEPSSHFQYANALQFDLAVEGAYRSAVSKFRTNFLTAVSPTISRSMFEQDIVAYTAEMIWLNRYQQAMSTVSTTFKNDSRRTYLSAPYFGSLESVYNSLVMNNSNNLTKIRQYISATNATVFEMQDLYNTLQLAGESTTRAVLEIPSKQASFNPSIAQASGLLKLYAQLYANNDSNTALLSPSIQICLDIIAQALIIEGDLLTITPFTMEQNYIQIIQTAKALIEFGSSTNNAEIEATGYFLYNSFIASNAPINAQQYAALYVHAVDNPYYPHSKILMNEDAASVWAWTISPDIVMSTTVDNETEILTLSTNFQVGNSHYMYINQLPRFDRIEMYGLNYRSDWQFEQYNSSGYVYSSANTTLFLKVRNRNEDEVIRLFYDPVEEILDPPTETLEQTEETEE